MKRIILILAALSLAAVLDAQTLEDGFAHPPQEARPRVWWHWMDGNVTLDGIRKDIEWMDRIGIGGFHQFDAGGVGMKLIVDKPRTYGSQPWKEAYRYAIGLATEKGMETAVASAPGWSSTGGPWVGPEDAMKKLTWRTVEVEGPGRRTLVLPALYDTPGKYQNFDFDGKVAPWSKYVATIAVRLPEAEKSLARMGAEVSSSEGRFTVAQLSNGDFSDETEIPEGEGGRSWISYSFDEAQTVRAMTLGGCHIREQYYALPPEYHDFLEASNDGKTWWKVFDIPTSSLPVLTTDIPATKAKYFRLNLKGGRKVSEFVLHTVVKVNHAEDKAGFASPHDFAEYLTPESSDPVTEVIDLSLMDKDGHLDWNVPEGRWRIYRFGMSLTGKENHPAPPEATGLEVDKLDPGAWNRYFSEFLKIYEGIPVEYLLTDSYEAGQMTWTPNMFEEFKSRRGYGLATWLPALTGEIIRGTEETERFLFDWRQTLGELFAENYQRLGEIAHHAGMKGRYIESHENARQFVGDGMDVKRGADIPMSAIWMDDALVGSPIPMARADIRESASVAHIFGKKFVAAESLTSSGVGGKSYSYCPENMKYTADVALSCGLNRFVIHESSHQPDDIHVPGLDLIGFGQWFNRHDTWAEEAKVWTDYLARSSFLLQQGKFRADILYFYGEDNCITGLFGHNLPDIPSGHSFDFINPYGLINAVNPAGGHLVTASGMDYRLLVLGPDSKTMSVPVLRRILELARAGVPVCGSLPDKDASLADNPEEFNTLREELKGLIMEIPVDKALEKAGIEPDFVAPKDWAFVHRETDDEDIYWIRNFSGAPASSTVRVKAGQGQPRVMDPATGEVRWISASKDSDGHRVFRLDMEENDALFVVIGKDWEEEKPVLTRMEKEITEMTGPWELSFVSGLGAPEKTVFDRLISYTDSPDRNIRYYSGTVIYRKSFKLTRKQLRGSASFAIDLGSVKNLARVYVNGQDIGVAWKAPFKLNIPEGCLHPGVNLLEVKVINLWPNRIIGDLQPDNDRTWTYISSLFYTPESPLLPSGLLGPVRIKSVNTSINK